MTDFKAGDLVRVPFPFTNRPTRQYRPAIVVSTGGLGDEHRLLWVAMVTSAENRRWPGDLPIEEDHISVGLPSPSMIRTAKIMTIEASKAEWRGNIGADRLKAVYANIASNLGWAL